MKEFKCTACGGKIVMDANMEFGICQYCGTLFKNEDIKRIIVKKDINIEEKINNANQLLKLRQYDKAKSAFNELTKDVPSDWRGWYGLIQAETHMFSIICENIINFPQIISYNSGLFFYQNKEKENSWINETFINNSKNAHSNLWNIVYELAPNNYKDKIKEKEVEYICYCRKILLENHLHNIEDFANNLQIEKQKIHENHRKDTIFYKRLLFFFMCLFIIGTCVIIFTMEYKILGYIAIIVSLIASMPCIACLFLPLEDKRNCQNLQRQIEKYSKEANITRKLLEGE